MAQLPATPSESFGLSVEQVRKLRSPGAGDDVRPQVLSSVVTALSARADGRHVIALANGQIWVQGEAWEVLHLSVGDAVTVKPGVLGSYYLRAPSGSATRVTRAQ